LQSLRGRALHPAICLKNAELVVNFGSAPFKHPPPPGFVCLAQAPRSVTAHWGDAPADDGSRKPLAIILEPARWEAPEGVGAAQASPAGLSPALLHSSRGAAAAARVASAAGSPVPSARFIFPSLLALACRDLAEQTHGNVALLGKHLSDPALRTALLVGGTPPAQQLRALQQGVDIVTGTPGG
jgi:ATP-dependent RNA helicase DDX1